MLYDTVAFLLHFELSLLFDFVAMSLVRVLALVLAIYSPLTNGNALGENSNGQTFFIYREQIKVIHQILAKECPEYLDIKRAVTPDLHPFDVNVEKAVYERMFEKLMACRTKPCRSATDLTESWRMSHNASKLLPGGPSNSGGQACDLRNSLQWFRFTGAAGK